MITINLNFKYYLEKVIDLGKEFSSEFFSNQENIDLLNNNDFDTLYIKWGVYPAGLTALLIKSNIEFLSYMSSLPSGCFEGLPIEYIEIPNNIKDIRVQPFKGCKDLKVIKFENSFDGVKRICGNTPTSLDALKNYLSGSDTTLRYTDILFKYRS